MDVIICQPVLGLGGAENSVLRIARHFNAPIYTASYSQCKTLPEFSELDVRLIKPSLMEAPASLASRLDFDARLQMLAPIGMRLLFTKIREDYDVISAHAMPSELIRARNDRMVWYCHGTYGPQHGWNDFLMAERGVMGKAVLSAASGAYGIAQSLAVPKIEKICANSRFTAGNLAKYLKRPDAQAIYPGVEPSEFKCEDYRKFFFYPSRIAPEKRMEFALNAFRQARLKGWKLVMGGFLFPSARNTRYFEFIKGQARGLDVEFKTDLSRKEMLWLYSHCRATLFTPIMEPLGVIPLESMASSKPCIAVNEGGAAEFISDGKNGFAVSTPGQMAERMRFLADHLDVCEKMGKAGRKLVEQNYTWKTFLGKMEKAFKETAKM